MRFQFTPLREGRPGGVLHNHQRQDFNSRPSARGDVFYQPTSVIIAISIHAPPRGATCRRDGIHRTWDFNSRPSARGDQCALPRVNGSAEFQFTPLREGRHDASNPVHRPEYFNSRPSARGDVRSVLYYNHKDGRFQFTPLREGRPSWSCISTSRNTFQFTPLREGRLFQRCSVGDEWKISIHAPPRGATCQLAGFKLL